MRNDLKNYLREYNKVKEKKLYRAFAANPNKLPHPIYVYIDLDVLHDAGIMNPYLDSQKGFFWLDISETSNVSSSTIFTNWIDEIAKANATYYCSEEELRDDMIDRLFSNPIVGDSTIYNYDPFKASFSSYLTNIAKSHITDVYRKRKAMGDEFSNPYSLNYTYELDSGSDPLTLEDMVSDNISSEDAFLKSPEFTAFLIRGLQDNNLERRNAPLKFREAYIPDFKFKELGVNPEYLDEFSYLNDLKYVRYSDRVQAILFLSEVDAATIINSCVYRSRRKIDKVIYVDYIEWKNSISTSKTVYGYTDIDENDNIVYIQPLKIDSVFYYATIMRRKLKNLIYDIAENIDEV